MINEQVQAMRITADGRETCYPTYTGVGVYPLFYLAEDCAEICPDCINTEECFHTEDSEEWNIISCEVNWEDPYMSCAHCGDSIDCAYDSDEDQFGYY